MKRTIAAWVYLVSSPFILVYWLSVGVTVTFIWAFSDKTWRECYEGEQGLPWVYY